MKKPTVAVIFGSRSTEHDVSIITAVASVIKPLEMSKKFHVVAVYITKDGRWFMGDKFKNIATYQKHIDDVLAKEKPVAVRLGQGLTLVRAGRFKGSEVKVDVVFPATHGTHGEDGELMAICEMAGVAYVGCDVESSVIAMDKVLAKETAVAGKIDTPKYVSFSKQAYETDSKPWQDKINRELHYPVFVKPAHLGSSIGITRVTDKKDLDSAIEVALHYDTKALVEEGVQNLVEVTLPIMGNEEPVPALLEEPLLKSEDFFDFETKYMQGGKGKGKGGAKGGGKHGAQGYSRIPADLPEDLYAKAEATGLNVYQALGCSGTARVDMLVDTKAKKVYFNEVNPLPGSLYSHNWSRAGISNVVLVERLVELAQKRFAKKESVATSFATNYLQQF
ncbi:MAG TPA: D-alanine--D-alanine ligase [Candidatus Saccharimonadales bacterium]